jgi:hypothetical protein
MRRSLARLARMDRLEAAWRAGTAARITYARIRSSVRPPRWNRRDLVHALASMPELAAARTALRRRQWLEAHRALCGHFSARAARFVIAPALVSTVRRRICLEFPDAARDAAARADRAAGGAYDLLGYRGLRFDRGTSLPTAPLPRGGDAGASASPSGLPDWHLDPVHDRRAPRTFWADVAYLDPALGDHKIIWEVNRHQHWLHLGRAFWLTGDGRYRDRCIEELASWLDANPPLEGINWASMLELAFRSLSWIWALNFFAAGSGADRSPWTVDLLLGLDRQLTHVEQNLSYYFSPNTHLLGEALALYVSGRSVPELAGSERRAATGRRVLLAEMDRQIGTDGGHSERSTHYHRYALDFYLLALAVARITRDPVDALFERGVAQLGTAARLLADDRGRVPHIGDDDGGALIPIAGRDADDWGDSLAAASALTGRPDLRVGPAPEEPFWLLAHPALSGTLDASRRAPVSDGVVSGALPDTGYYISRSRAGDHLIVDGGRHGYLNGGHAHADALSVAFTLRGRPLLIDSGTGAYTIDRELRDRMRSTALHNTLVLDDRDQSISTGPFHWSHTANGAVRRWRTNGSFDYFDGAHDGYHPIEHRRHVLALHGDLLIVADLVAGAGPHTAAVHWHIDPRWRVDASARGAGISTAGERASLHVTHGIVECFSADTATGLGWHAPVYGRLEPATTVRITHRAVAPMWIVSVFGLNAANTVIELEALPVWAEAGVLGHSTALRIRRATSMDYLVIAEPARDVASGTWRVAEFETDARMLFCRVTADHHVTRVALVDGSVVRSSARRALQLALPAAVSDLHLDMSGIRSSEPFEYARARIAGPAFGATLVVAGIERPIASERRGETRTKN